MIDKNYIISTNAHARDRLTLQHKLYEESSLKLLNIAKLKSNMHGLEIGCGAGDMTVHLAKFIINDGKLTSIDINDAQIKAAKERIRKKDLKVNFLNHDVSELNNLNEQYDFIYCRMVLHHLADASSAIKQMNDCLNTNGCLIIEEPVIHDGSFCYPENKAVIDFITWCRECFKKNNRDYNIAYRLHEEIKNNNMQLAHYNLCHPVLRTKEDKMMYAMGLVDLTPQILKHEIASRENIDTAYEQLLEFANSDSLSTWIRMHQVVAVK